LRIMFALKFNMKPLGRSLLSPNLITIFSIHEFLGNLSSSFQNTLNQDNMTVYFCLVGQSWGQTSVWDIDARAMCSSHTSLWTCCIWSLERCIVWMSSSQRACTLDMSSKTPWEWGEDKLCSWCHCEADLWQGTSEAGK
jgi:hypothetical protein